MFNEKFNYDSKKLATLDAAGKVPSSQLPSYVDDVEEYASASQFPATGEAGKIYVATDTNTTYRWSGSQYIIIGNPIVVDPAPVQGSTNAVSSGGVYTALGEKQDELTFDNAPTVGSTNPVTSDGIASVVSTLNSNISSLEDEIDSIGTATSIEDTEPYLFKSSARENVVGNIMNVQKIIGGTVAWNQLVNTNDTSVTVLSGRKYLKRISGADSIALSTGEAITVTGGTDNVFDLTQMFGSTIADYIYSLEQSTAGAGVAWFKKLFPKDYYAYNAGELISVNTNAHETVGFNQWDEEWENGYINTENGVLVVGTNIRSKNYIHVFSNTSYRYQSNGHALVICYYDASKNYIGYMQTANGERTTPNNACYVKFYMNLSYGIIYNHDICINLSKTTGSPKNGDYVPYKKHSYPLDPDLELRGIPKLDSNNKLYYDGDIYEPSGKVTRKYGIVDLGTLDWTYNVSNSVFLVPLDDAKKAVSTSRAFNGICTKYQVLSMSDATVPKISGLSPTTSSPLTNLYVYDPSFGTDVASFKTAMSGVYLVYELATPTTENADAYDKQQIFDVTGTEEYVDTRAVPIPVGHDTYFPNSLTSRIDALEDEFNEEIASLSESIAPTETSPATATHATGTYLMYQNRLYKVIASIAVGETLTVGTNIQATTIMAELLSLTA